MFLLTAIASAGFLMLYSVSGGRPHMWAEPQIERFVVGMIAMLGVYVRLRAKLVRSERHNKQQRKELDRLRTQEFKELA